MDDITARIDQELSRLDMSWADFARRLGTSDQGVYNWRKRGVPKKEIGRIASILGCTTDWLLLGKGQKYAPQIGETYRKYAAILPKSDKAALPAAEIERLLSQISKRSFSQLSKIIEATAKGRLSEEDVELLGIIAQRLAGTPAHP